MSARARHPRPRERLYGSTAAWFARSRDPRVEFKYKRIAEDEWQIEAHYPGAELRHFKGFKSEVETDEWLQGRGRIDWLRSQGYAK
jgi:hypothetical protein